MVLSNPGNQYMSLIAGIAQEPVSMTPRLTAETILLCACANICATVEGKPTRSSIVSICNETNQVCSLRASCVVAVVVS